LYKEGTFARKTNNAGGIEGGMTNGEPIVIRACMKPISTLRRPLESVDIRTKKSTKATVERSDTCAVPSGGVIAENVSAFVIADLFLEKFGGDSLKEIKGHYDSYMKMLKDF
jgi:chorismate synthase